MPGKRKAVKKLAKKAASDGKITKKEAAKIQQKAQKSGANNAAVAIARAAANNQAKIAQSVQQSLGITQNKNLTRASTTQAPAGNGAYVSGFQVEKGPMIKGEQKVTEKPIYTFQQKKPAVKTAATPANTEPAAADAAKEQDPMSNQTEQWSDSVDSGMSELEAILATQMEANAAQTDLYMGMMQDMMSQMNMANQQATQQAVPQGAYAVSAYQTPATGARTTKEITKRKPVANDSLSISSMPAAAAGVGLNLAI